MNNTGKLGIETKRNQWIKKSDIKPNPWNPNKTTDRQQEAILESIDDYSQLIPVIVRPHPVTVGLYEIIDGEHRYNAIGDDDDIFCTVVECDDAHAKKLTIVMNETKGKSDRSDLAGILAEINEHFDDEDARRALPYTDEEFSDFMDAANFNWDAYAVQAQPEPDKIVETSSNFEQETTETVESVETNEPKSEVISITLDEETITMLDALQDEFGASNRAETVVCAIQNAFSSI